MGVPVAVKLSGRTTRRVTTEVEAWSYDVSAPGGYAGAQVRFRRGQPTELLELQRNGRLVFEDMRSGKVLYDGRVQDPGRSVQGGYLYQVNAVGEMVSAREDWRPLHYVSTDMSLWEQGPRNTPGAIFEGVAEDPGGTFGQKAIVIRHPAGSPLVNGSRVAAAFPWLNVAGQKLAKVKYTWDGGLSGTYDVQFLVRTGASLVVVVTDSITTAGATRTATIGDTGWTAGTEDIAELHLLQSGAAHTPADGLRWASFRDVTVLSTRFSQSGSELTAGSDYPALTVTDVQVVADLLGRGTLPRYNGRDVALPAAGATIDHLVYLDGIDPARVLEEMCALADRTWMVFGRDVNGKYVFVYQDWPTVPAYQLPFVEGVDLPSTQDEMYNRARVRYVNAAGKVRFALVSYAVPELDDAGIVRTLPLDLGAETGNAAMATTYGTAVLKARSVPYASGTVVVRNPIRDLSTGLLRSPWEILPGVVAGIRGQMPAGNVLEKAGRDGQQTFRLVNVHAQSDGTATLTLDSRRYSDAELLARTRRQFAVRRRR